MLSLLNGRVSPGPWVKVFASICPAHPKNFLNRGCQFWNASRRILISFLAQGIQCLWATVVQPGALKVARQQKFIVHVDKAVPRPICKMANYSLDVK